MKKTIALLMVASLFLGGCSSRTSDNEVSDAVTDSDLSIGAATDADADADSDLDTEEEIVIPLVDPENIQVFSNPPALLTGDETNAIITAVVTDDQNRAIAGHEVSFSTDSGVLQNISAITNENGEATAELNLIGDFVNKNISITAGVEDLISEASVVAQGSEVTMVAPQDLIVGETADLEFTLLSGAGTPIPNELIQFNSGAGNSFSQNSAVTNALGVVNISMTTTAGADLISAIALDGTAVSNLELPVAENVQAVVTPVRLRVITNESVIETGGSDVATITTLVTDESNRVLSGQKVEFSSTGGILLNISEETNEAGQATAELSLEGDYRNQDIVVTAVLDDQSGEVLISTEGSKVSVAGPTALVSGDTADLEITLTGGDEQPIPNEIISITSTVGNSILPATAITDSDGKVIITVGSESGSDTILVEALDSTVAAEHALEVAADILNVVPGSYDDMPVSEFSPFAVVWSSSGLPVGGKLMRFSTTAGILIAAGSDGVGSSSIDVLTDANGVASVELKSNSAGPATISYAGLDETDPASQYEVEFVAIEPAVLSLNATPASVATGNSSTVTAMVVDPYGNPVKDTLIEFSSADLRGGSLSPVSAITDSDGSASITFNAGTLPTETDGIEISAEVTSNTAVAASVDMTITERQLNVIIGLSGSLVELQSDTRYSKTGVVQVTDGAGRPVPDATIQVSLLPTFYRYGSMVPVDVDGDDEADKWGLSDTFTLCQAEDENGNRILDAGEDSNGNGILDPRDPALVDVDPANSPTVIGGEITTDASGAGFFTIVYPQSNALYFDVRVTARVEALGVEGVADYEHTLTMSAADATNLDALPPNDVSPYGYAPLMPDPGCVTILGSP